MKWLGGFTGEIAIEPEFNFDQQLAQGFLEDSQQTNFEDAVNPTIELIGTTYTVHEGKPGSRLDENSVVQAIQKRDYNTAADASSSSDSQAGSIEIQAKAKDVAPDVTDEAAQQQAELANRLTAHNIDINVEAKQVEISANTLRSWISIETKDGAPSVKLDEEALWPALQKATKPLEVPAKDAKVNFDPATGVAVEPSQTGRECCETGSTAKLREYFLFGDRSSPLSLDFVDSQPDHSTEEAQAIKEPVARFTTNHAPGEARVTNIHKFADLMKGAIIWPGETFSLNNWVGPRTAEKGFVSAGVILKGEFKEDIGGGVSQFATTTFNAAFFAGLEFKEYMAHTIYISRYPYGREATISYPAPDLKIYNPTPYPVLIWPTYTDSSITVTLYSTPYVTAEQTGQSEEPVNACKRVKTQRTRTYLDGTTKIDYVYAVYQPKEGVLCV